MTASFDYSGLKTTADSLIERFGIVVSLDRVDRTASLDSWEQDQGPASTSDAQSISAFGIQTILDKNTLDIGSLGLDTVERPLGQWAIQAAAALPEQMSTGWKLAANGFTYDVLNVRPVQPGSTLLLYFLIIQL